MARCLGSEVSDYVDGRMSPAHRERWARHLAGCSRCTSEVAAEEALLTRLRASLSAPSSDLQASLLAIAQTPVHAGQPVATVHVLAVSAPQAPTYGPALPRRVAVAVLGVAASVSLVVCGGIGATRLLQGPSTVAAGGEPETSQPVPQGGDESGRTGPGRTGPGRTGPGRTPVQGGSVVVPAAYRLSYAVLPQLDPSSMPDVPASDGRVGDEPLLGAQSTP